MKPTYYTRYKQQHHADKVTNIAYVLGTAAGGSLEQDSLRSVTFDQHYPLSQPDIHGQMSRLDKTGVCLLPES